MPADNEMMNWIVLIVDDEPDNIGVAQKILSFYGAKVYTASNGVEALEIMKTVTPTIILLDLSMPQMDGWETMRHLQANSDLAQIPVVALTAHVNDEFRKRAEIVGFADFIHKPYSLVDLRARMKIILRRSAAKRLENEP
jgi:CheY-like chemotaxis protein